MRLPMCAGFRFPGPRPWPRSMSETKSRPSRNAGAASGPVIARDFRNAIDSACAALTALKQAY